MENKKDKAARKYNEADVIKLLVASGGRCTLCNADVMTDIKSHLDIKVFEKAHIKAFSDLGPRADSSLSIAERNSINNLMIVCPTCHAIIDSKVGRGVYTVEWLKNKKATKQKQIKYILEKLNDSPCLVIKYFSAIGSQNALLCDQDIYRLAFENGFCYYNEIVNLNEDCNSEDIDQSIKLLNTKFEKRVQRLFDNAEEPKIILFARAPQPLLIYLGTLFNDKHDVKIFTSHRNNQWLLNETTVGDNKFLFRSPERKDLSNKVAITISSTAKVKCERVYNAIGGDTDIWEIEAEHIEVDNIHNQNELLEFYKVCVYVLDKIGEIYGKDKEINIFCAMCNSLAITFGRAIFAKSHNRIKIFDTIKENGSIKEVLKLTI